MVTRVNRISHFAILLLVCIIAGCSHTPPLPAGSINSPPSFALSQIPDAEVESQLVMTAQSIERSLRLLAAVNSDEVQRAINTSVLITPEGGMAGLATVDWSGPIEPLVQRIADLTQYELKVLGQEPPVALVVSVTGQNVPVADLLKDAGLQLGKRADLVVYPNIKVIELRYAAL